VAPERPRPLSARERVEQAFARYLARERGLASATLMNNVPVVRQFLRERFRGGGSGSPPSGRGTSPASCNGTRTSTVRDTPR